MTTRQFVLALLAICVVAIPLSHSMVSAKKAAKKKGPAPKQAICHFPDDSEIGHVIEVSENAVAAHVSKHGDCTQFLTDEDGGCRCLTCPEICRVERARCEESCEGDTACIARCNNQAQQCVENCSDGEPGAG
jgi:hypothetical protein